jgi:nicotinate-nucleotide adenylyltransferase
LLSTSAPVSPLNVPAATSHVVLLGGSFDPPHTGHVALASAARDAVDRDATLVVVPAATSPFKVGVDATSARVRCQLASLAFAQVQRAVVWTDEVDRAKQQQASYTIDTISRLVSVFAGRVTLLIGTDQAVQFHRWRESSRLLALCDVRVLLREPLATATALREALAATGVWSRAQLDAWDARALHTGLPLHPASSSAIRSLIKTRGIDSVPTQWLAPRVREEIQRQGLYV